MDFGLSEEQRLLAENLRRYLEAEVPVSRVREIAARSDAHDAALWSSLAEMGVVGMLVPEAEGGGGLGLLDAVEAGLVADRCITPAPFLGTAVMAAVALRESGTEAQRRTTLAAARLNVGTVDNFKTYVAAFALIDPADVDIDVSGYELTVTLPNTVVDDDLTRARQAAQRATPLHLSLTLVTA